jgi:hypothetical protein
VLDEIFSHRYFTQVSHEVASFLQSHMDVPEASINSDKTADAGNVQHCGE